MRHAATVLVTHRYQDGAILARYRYDEASGGLRRISGDGAGTHTRYLVLRDGENVFLGSPEELEASKDPYVAKFVPAP